MKKIILFFVALLSVAATKAAALTPPDTLVVNKPNRVTVITSNSLQTSGRCILLQASREHLACRHQQTSARSALGNCGVLSANTNIG